MQIRQVIFFQPPGINAYTSSPERANNPQSDPNSLIYDREGLRLLCDTYVAPDSRIQGESTQDTIIILLAHLFLLYSDMEHGHRHSQRPSWSWYQHWYHKCLLNWHQILIKSNGEQMRHHSLAHFFLLYSDIEHEKQQIWAPRQSATIKNLISTMKS